MALGVDVRVAGFGEIAVGGLDVLGRGVVVDLMNVFFFLIFDFELFSSFCGEEKEKNNKKREESYPEQLVVVDDVASHRRRVGGTC